jgi:hypothetical protein
MGKRKYIETPEKMWELFSTYKNEINENPFKVKDWVGKDAKEIKREYVKVLTMEGFECFAMDHTDIQYPDLTEYFEGKNESYKDYFPVCSRIKREIRRDQIEKGLSSLANPSITQRLNGLVDRVETETTVIDKTPIFTANGLE